MTLHLGADLFEPAAQAQHMNTRLARKISRKHDANHPGVHFLQKVKRKLSAVRDNADTLTWTSTGQSNRGGSRSRLGTYRQFKRLETAGQHPLGAQASASEGAYVVEPPWKRRKHDQCNSNANELMLLVQDRQVDGQLILGNMQRIMPEDLVTMRDNIRGAGYQKV